MLFLRRLWCLLGIFAVSCTEPAPDLVSIIPAPTQTHQMLLSELREAQSETRSGPGQQLMIDAFWRPHFRLRNPHDVPVTVTLLHQDCSCYRTLWNERELPVGHRQLLAADSEATLTLDVSPPARAGRQSWTIHLELASGQTRVERELTAQLVVHPDLDVTPPVLNYDLGETAGPPALLNVVLTTQQRLGTDEPLTISGLPAFLHVAHLERLGARPLPGALWQQEWTVELAPRGTAEPAPGSGSGPLSDWGVCEPALAGIHAVHLAATLPDGRQRGKVVGLRIRDRHQLLGPRSVAFGRVIMGTRCSRRVQLRSADGSDFEIRRLHAPTSISARVLDAKSDDRHWLELDFAPMEAGPFTDILQISTTHPDAPRHEVRLHATVVPPTAPAKTARR